MHKIQLSSIGPLPFVRNISIMGRGEERGRILEKLIPLQASIKFVRTYLSCIVHLSNEIVGYTHTHIHTHSFYTLWVYDVGLLAIVHGRLPVIRDVLLPPRWRLNPVEKGEGKLLLLENSPEYPSHSPCKNEFSTFMGRFNGISRNIRCSRCP